MRLSQMILRLSGLLLVLPIQTCVATLPYWYWYTTSEEIAVYDTVLNRECPVSNISATKKVLTSIIACILKIASSSVVIARQLSGC